MPEILGHPLSKFDARDWDTWCDGQPRRFVQGKDFVETPAEFRVQAGQQARNRKLDFECYIQRDTVLFQTSTPT